MSELPIHSNPTEGFREFGKAEGLADEAVGVLFISWQPVHFLVGRRQDDDRLQTCSGVSAQARQYFKAGQARQTDIEPD